MYLTHVLDDSNKEDRAAGLAAGISLLYKCDVLIFGDKYGVSEGMYGEVQEARAQGIPVVDFELHKSIDDFIKAVKAVVRNRHGVFTF